MAAELPTSRSGKSALEVARLCAQEGGRIAMEGFGRVQRVQVKGRGNITTAADLASERAIKEMLAAEYPEHAVLSEETAATSQSEGWMWVVDPLDGTRNYASGIPLFCVNIALCHGAEPRLGLTYDPVREEEFQAEAGQGAFVDGVRMHASQAKSVQASVLAVDLGYDDQRAAHLISLVHEIWPAVQSVRIVGSAALALAYAAAGRFDLMVHHMLYPWDVAAGILLVREAGGLISDRDGAPITIRSEGAIAGGPKVHADFLRLAAGHPWR